MPAAARCVARLDAVATVTPASQRALRQVQAAFAAQKSAIVR